MSRNDLLKTISINDGDNRRRVTHKGLTIGWITKWHERDSLNGTGIPRYNSKPIGLSEAANCETYEGAVSYLLHFHGLK